MTTIRKGLLGGLFFLFSGLAVSPLFAQVELPLPAREPKPEITPLTRTSLIGMPEWKTVEEVRASQSWTVIGVGDMMLGTHYPSRSYLPPNEGRDMLARVKPTLLSADITFGNLEGTLIDEGGTVKRCSNPAACYAFRSPESYGAHFKEAGFDLLSLANNHSGDFGLEGRRRTKAVLEANGIAYAGLTGTDEYTIVERAGLRVGMCAFAPNNGTLSIHDLGKATELVRWLKDSCDLVIVSFHGGAEGATNQHVPRKSETYYGENRGDVYRFAHAVVDAGADIVFGHGPHVTRAAELYKDRFIIYSLGNFCTYGRFNLRGPAGYAPMIKLRVDRTGRFLEGQVFSIYQEKEHGPYPDPENRALHKLIELSNSDFPESPLIFGKDGFFYKAVPQE